VYPPATVSRLRRIAEALARGHRAGEIVPATDGALDRLLSASEPAGPLPATSLPAMNSVDGLLDLVAHFDSDRLTAALLADWARMSPVAFVATRIGPLVHAVGERWADGQIEIRHEHFLSERLGDLLRSLRLSFDLRAGGPHVICATLPGESHGLGLQMAALVLAVAGLRVTYLGTETPPKELATLARELPARVVALSISAAARRDVTLAQLARLRRALPRNVTLLVGGAGAWPSRGVTVAGDAVALEQWARLLSAGVLSAPPKAAQ
jgi:methanogenic corrinoid protein MtbC1